MVQKPQEYGSGGHSRKALCLATLISQSKLALRTLISFLFFFSGFSRWGFSNSLGGSRTHFIDQAGFKLIEMGQPLPPRC